MKAKLSGMFTVFPASMAIALVALVVFLFAQANLTEYSVFVNGYTRSDGRSVSSYSRRPPGSVAYDQPYALLDMVGIVGMAIGGLGASCTLWVFLRA